MIGGQYVQIHAWSEFSHLCALVYHTTTRARAI
jgi:hypothetical protein